MYFSDLDNRKVKRTPGLWLGVFAFSLIFRRVAHTDYPGGAAPGPLAPLRRAGERASGWPLLATRPEGEPDHGTGRNRKAWLHPAPRPRLAEPAPQGETTLSRKPVFDGLRPSRSADRQPGGQPDRSRAHSGSQPFVAARNFRTLSGSAGSIVPSTNASTFVACIACSGSSSWWSHAPSASSEADTKAL